MGTEGEGPFGKLGRAMAGRPGRFAAPLIGFVVMLALAALVITEQYELASSFQALWFKTDSKEFIERDFVDNNKQRQKGWSLQALGRVSKIEGDNVLTKEGINEELQLYNLIKRHKIPSPRKGEGDPDFEFLDVAATLYDYGSPPFRFSVLDCWQLGAFDWFPEASRSLLDGLLWTGSAENEWGAGYYGPCDEVSLTHVTRGFLDLMDNGKRDRSTWGPTGMGYLTEEDAFNMDYEDPWLVNAYNFCWIVRLVVGLGYKGINIDTLHSPGPCRPFINKEAMEANPFAMTMTTAFDYTRYWAYTFYWESPNLVDCLDFDEDCKDPRKQCHCLDKVPGWMNSTKCDYVKRPTPVYTASGEKGPFDFGTYSECKENYELFRSLPEEKILPGVYEGIKALAKINWEDQSIDELGYLSPEFYGSGAYWSVPHETSEESMTTRASGSDHGDARSEIYMDIDYYQKNGKCPNATRRSLQCRKATPTAAPTSSPSSQVAEEEEVEVGGDCPAPNVTCMEFACYEQTLQECTDDPVCALNLEKALNDHDQSAMLSLVVDQKAARGFNCLICRCREPLSEANAVLLGPVLNDPATNKPFAPCTADQRPPRWPKHCDPAGEWNFRHGAGPIEGYSHTDYPPPRVCNWPGRFLCKDDPEYQDAAGTGCEAWAGKDCESICTSSEAGLAELLDHCPRACGKCNSCDDNSEENDPLSPDKNKPDKFWGPLVTSGECSGWAGFDCADAGEDSEWDQYNVDRLLRECPKTCKTCDAQVQKISEDCPVLETSEKCMPDGATAPPTFPATETPTTVSEMIEAMEWNCTGDEKSSLGGGDCEDDEEEYEVWTSSENAESTKVIKDMFGNDKTVCEIYDESFNFCHGWFTVAMENVAQGWDKGNENGRATATLGGFALSQRRTLLRERLKAGPHAEYWSAEEIVGAEQSDSYLLKDEKEFYDNVLIEWIKTLRDEYFPAGGVEGDTTKASGLFSVSFAEISEKFNAASVGVILGPIVMGTYACITMSHFVSGKPGAAVLGAVGVFTVALGIFGALGLSAALGVMWTGNSLNVIPFLILGLGVDDMFLIAHTYKDYAATPKPGESTEDLVARVMGYVGPSITLTSASNFVVFLLGVLTPLPMTAYFSYQAAIAVALIYVTMITVLPSIIAIFHDLFVARSRIVPVAEAQAGKSSHGESKGFRTKYAAFVTGNAGKVVSLAVVMAFTVVSIIGILEFKPELSLLDVFNPGTVEYEFLEGVYYGKAFKGKETAQIQYLEFDYPQLQVAYIHVGRELEARIKAEGLLQPESYNNWMEAFIEWGEDTDKCSISPYCGRTAAENITKSLSFDWMGFDVAKFPNGPPRCISKPLSGERVRLKFEDSPHWKSSLAYDPDEFYPCLELWLNEGGFSVQTSGHGLQTETSETEDEHTKLWHEWGGKVKLSSGTLSVKDLNEPDDFMKLVNVVKEYELEAERETGVKFFCEGGAFLLFSQFEKMYDTMYQCFGSGMAAIFVLVLTAFIILTKNPVESVHLTIIITIAIVMLVFFTAGMFSFGEIWFNQFSILTLITSVGIAVEFTVHMVFAYMTADGSRTERTKAAVEHMALPTIDSSLSTFLGIVFLGLSDFNFVYKYNFLAYSMLVLSGLVVGLILLPFLLAVAGPSRSK